MQLQKMIGWGLVTLEGQESIFVKITFELRAQWQENRSFDNV